MAFRHHEIYVALCGVTSPDAVIPVGVITIVESVAGAIASSSFTYLTEYAGPALDPIHLDFRKSKSRTFVVPDLLLKSGLHRVFCDSMPGSWGRRLFLIDRPALTNASDALLLSAMAAEGHASGALLFFTKTPGNERALTSGVCQRSW